MSRPARARGLKQSKVMIYFQVFVAPRAGAWIETSMIKRHSPFSQVAPRAGAWIETFGVWSVTERAFVAPRAGAWIETSQLGAARIIVQCRAPRGRVD